MNNIIAARSKEIRRDLGLTQSQFGEKLSTSQDTVSHWELGTRFPTTDFVISICRIFDISADYLLGLKDF